MPSADPEKIFAETLCLISTVTARTAAASLASGQNRVDEVAEAILALPYTLHAYVAGTDVLAGGVAQEPSEALSRMMQFYGVQLPQGEMPTKPSLRKVMILWMGRISPSGLGEHPEQRLKRLEFVERMDVHARLVEAYARSAV